MEDESDKCRVVFFGTPEEVVPVAQSVSQSPHFKIVLVVTRPDAPRGRGLKVEPSPVKVWAETHGIQVLTPEKLTDEHAQIIKEAEAQVGLCAAYGKIVPSSVLSAFERGIVNIHPSLLPRWRGPAPVQRAIENGDTITGVTFMIMTEGLDEGPVLCQIPVQIEPDERAGELLRRLFRISAAHVCDVLLQYVRGEIQPVPQEGEVTYASKIKKEEGKIDWREPAENIYNKMRAFHPWPGIFTTWGERLLKIHDGIPESGDTHEPAGTVVGVDENGIKVQTGKGIFRITELQVAGKKRVRADEFIRGYRIKEGDTLG